MQLNLHAQYGVPFMRTDGVLARETYKLFRRYPDIFPHIRYDYIQRTLYEVGGALLALSVETSSVISGALIYKIYKRNSGLAKKGDILICQIVALERRKGIGSTLMNCLPTNVDAYVTVRASNIAACDFYLKHGFSRAGTTSWAKGSISGLIFKKRSVK